MARLAAVPDQPGRMVAYVRVSALMGRGGEDFHSPDLQHHAITRHTGPLGLREVATVQDIDVSGRTFSREGLDRIRAMVEAGQVDVVAVYDLSRLGRNAGEALRFIKWLRQHKVGIISTVEKIDDTPEGQFILTQFLALAELYSNQVGRRWKEVIHHRAALGFHNGGPPLGYYRDGGRIFIDPVIGPAITEAFRAYARGTPIMHIAQAVAKVRGKRTQVTTMKRVLSNPVYVGKVALWGVGRHRTPTVHDVPILLVPGEHEPLTDQATFDRCIERHKRDARTFARHLNPTHSLVGLVCCDLCGRLMQMRVDKRNKEPTPRLQCGVRVSSRDCPGPGMPAVAQVEAAVLTQVREYIRLLRGDVAAQAAQLSRTARAGADVTTLERELTGARESMARLAAGWAAGKVPDSAYELAMAPLKAAEKELELRIGEARGRAAGPPPGQVANLAEQMLRLWPQMTTAEQNVALKEIVSKVTVRRAGSYREPVADRIVVEWL